MPLQGLAPGQGRASQVAQDDLHHARAEQDRQQRGQKQVLGPAQPAQGRVPASPAHGAASRVFCTTART